MSLETRVEKPHRRVPDLRRRVVPELCRNDLVQCEVQTRIHRRAADVDPLIEAFLERRFQLGMLVTDHDRAHVGISEFLNP